MIRWLTNRGKCKSLRNNISTELEYRMHVMVYHRHDELLYRRSWLIWYKLYRWRLELDK